MDLIFSEMKHVLEKGRKAFLYIDYLGIFPCFKLVAYAILCCYLFRIEYINLKNG